MLRKGERRMKIRACKIGVASLLIVVALSSGLIATTTGGGQTARYVHYKGSLDTWYSILVDGSWETYYGGKVVKSNWVVWILNSGTAHFFTKFSELNVGEEVPGTYDDFVVWMRTDDIEENNDDGYRRITGTTNWRKNMVETFTWETVITISETDYAIQFIMDLIAGPLPAVWRITGSLLP